LKSIFIILISLIILISKAESQYIKINKDNRFTVIQNIQDTIKKKTVFKKRSIAGLFLGAGGGLSVPLGKFRETANTRFGILGKLEYSSTGIFPFVIGGEVNYYSYNSPDEFRTINLLPSYRTKILSYGLCIDYVLSKLFKSSFTIPYVSIDVKNNMIKRDYDENKVFEDLLREETKISIGAGFGFTMFIFDFTVKYNYMKNNSNISVTTKTKIPLIRF
jgi:hypothetical protein